MLDDVHLKARVAIQALGRMLDFLTPTPAEDARRLLDWSGRKVTAAELHAMRRKALAQWHPDKRESWKSALPPPRMDDLEDDEAHSLFTVDYYVRLYNRLTMHHPSGRPPSPVSYSFYLGRMLTECLGNPDRAEALLSEQSTIADIEAREHAAGQSPTMRTRILERLQGIRELTASRAEVQAKAPGGFDDIGHRVVDALAYLEQNCVTA
jgi:hypothetical protein